MGRGSLDRTKRTVPWPCAIVWGLCGLIACATSPPEHRAQAVPKIVGLNVAAGGRTCLIDADVPQADRQAVDTTALAFVKAAFGAHPNDAYEMMTAETRGIGSPDAFAAMIRTQAAALSTDLHVVHTYWIESSGDGAADSAVCGLREGRQWISVALQPERKQAYVAIAGKTINNDFRLTVWLVPRAGKWAVESFHLGLESVAGRSADDVLELARKERDAGHDFNAAALYVILRSLVNRGPQFHLAIEQDAAKDFEPFQVPPELFGTPPFTWTLDGKKFTVESATITGIHGELGLVFLLPLAAWTGTDAADKSNREFITAFIAAHPDYSRVFQFLVARALMPDKSGGFGTVYQHGVGFK